MAITRSRSAAGRGSYLAIAAFAVVYLVGAVYWPRPLWVAGAYLATSMICFALYAIDKRRARFGAWRVSEGTLLFWGFIGGWPGAIVAQQVLRHKTQKKNFRAVFWATVALNVGLFVAASSPAVDRLTTHAVQTIVSR
ncbi:DUF1294 domain-containing protein [Cryobacterium sp. PH31-L1]|uniref:DUF1294 domain-containing protein n=1 Tax=Cryobacterium sp. PH31-L1 TaxID=3046199 RepID=UPI0024BA4D51|nr:DUF1294 domain-containing protein [Cryobacterium sp. PH31-L1]MDJ0377571.1 DUF1294 domain-containing protein [Cryobacterium sp. PH31-L1]